MTRQRRTFVCLLLAGAMIGSPSMVYAQQLAVIRSARAERADGADLSYVTPGAVFAAVAHPRRVLTAPGMEMLPLEVMSAAGKKELGIDPLDVHMAIAALGNFNVSHQHTFSAIFQRDMGAKGNVAARCAVVTELILRYLANP